MPCGGDTVAKAQRRKRRGSKKDAHLAAAEGEMVSQIR